MTTQADRDAAAASLVGRIAMRGPWHAFMVGAICGLPFTVAGIALARLIRWLA